MLQDHLALLGVCPDNTIFINFPPTGVVCTLGTGLAEQQPRTNLFDQRGRRSVFLLSEKHDKISGMCPTFCPVPIVHFSISYQSDAVMIDMVQNTSSIYKNIKPNEHILVKRCMTRETIENHIKSHFWLATT